MYLPLGLQVLATWWHSSLLTTSVAVGRDLWVSGEGPRDIQSLWTVGGERQHTDGRSKRRAKHRLPRPGV